MTHNYVCHKRFKDKCMCGDVNISYGTELQSIDGTIYFEGKPICYDTSANACEYFVINDDWKGMERASYIKSILRILSQKDDKHQKRWDKIWEDPLSNTLRRKDYDNYWIWDISFYQASIENLQHILNLIKEV